MSDSLLDAFLNVLLGKAGRDELDRVSKVRRELRREDRDQKMEKMKEASETVTANMSPARKALIDSALSVQRSSEQRVFEGMTDEQKDAMKEDALDQVFSGGGGLKGD